MIVEAASLGPLPVVGLTVARQGDEAYAVVVARCPNAPCNLVAVDLRQADVEQHDGGLEFGSSFASASLER